LSVNPATKLPTFSEVSFQTLILYFRALHFSFSSRDRRCMEQSWHNRRVKTLCFPTLRPKHCSIDPSFSFERRARATEHQASTAAQSSERSAVVSLPVRRAQRGCPNGDRAEGGSPKSSKPRVTVVLQFRSPNACFSRLLAPALQHARETLSSQKYFWLPCPLPTPTAYSLSTSTTSPGLYWRSPDGNTTSALAPTKPRMSDEPFQPSGSTSRSSSDETSRAG
jgi:hypothetical protein